MRARPETLAHARQMRRALTRGEFALWQVLRRRAFADRRFRRQHPFGPYVLDFYCASARLAIEVDGPVHEEDPQAAHDFSRDRYLAGQGVRTLRVISAEVLGDIEGVLAKIAAALKG